MEPAGGHQHDDTVKRLLDQARSAIQASNAAQALQVTTSNTPVPQMQPRNQSSVYALALHSQG